MTGGYRRIALQVNLPPLSARGSPTMHDNQHKNVGLGAASCVKMVSANRLLQA
jgi:hypothetical protein